MSKFIIKEFEKALEDQVVTLILSIQVEEFGVAITRKDQPDLLSIPEFYQKGNGNFWCAIVGNDVVGTISLKDIGQQKVALRKMFVREDFRGKEAGVAKALLDHATKWCMVKKVNTIFLGTTDKFKAAHRFYEREGFDEIAKDHLPGSFPVMSVDSKFYRKSL